MPTDPDSSGHIPLDYARPVTRPSYVAFCVAITFGVVATLLGVAWLIAGISILRGAWRFHNSRDFEGELLDGARMIAAAIVLIASGLWYGRTGYRGLQDPRLSA